MPTEGCGAAHFPCTDGRHAVLLSRQHGELRQGAALDWASACGLAAEACKSQVRNKQHELGPQSDEQAQARGGVMRARIHADHGCCLLSPVPFAPFSSLQGTAAFGQSLFLGVHAREWWTLLAVAGILT